METARRMRKEPSVCCSRKGWSVGIESQNARTMDVWKDTCVRSHPLELLFFLLPSTPAIVQKKCIEFHLKVSLVDNNCASKGSLFFFLVLPKGNFWVFENFYGYLKRWRYSCFDFFWLWFFSQYSLQSKFFDVFSEVNLSWNREKLIEDWKTIGEKGNWRKVNIKILWRPYCGIKWLVNRD